MLERYGVENAMQLDSTKEKSRETTRSKHGVDHYTQTDEYREKVKASNLEKYGVEHTGQREDVKGKIAETLEERYGGHHLKNEEVKAKQRATNIERYGVENVAQNEEVKQRIRETNLERYGVEVSLLNPEVAAKREATWMSKYGTTHAITSPQVLEKIRDSLQKSHGVDNAFQSDAVRAKAKLTMLERYGVEYALQDPTFLAKQMDSVQSAVSAGLSKPRRVSKINEKLAEKIRDRFGVAVTFEKTVKPYSFDLFVEAAGVLIDINPTVTHNSQLAFQCLLSSCELPCDRHSPRPNDYHYRRALAAREAGYSLIQIYDWDSEESVLRLLAGKLEKDFTRYSARKLKRVRLEQREANEFLSSTHIQGGAKSQSHCYGLRDDAGELVAVATFGPARFGAGEEYEWVRYAVRPRSIVHGGPNALWRAFREGASPSSVISYVDFDHSTAPNLFLSACDFTEDRPTGPSRAWSKGDRRIYNNSLLKLGADRLLNTAYGSREESGLDNDAIMMLEGWLPIYTSGNRVFRWADSAN